MLADFVVNDDFVRDEPRTFLAPGPSADKGMILFSTPAIEDIPSINIYQNCTMGTCNCVHLIGEFPSQLKPCRAAQFLFGSSALPTVSDSDKLYLWKGLMKGFRIVDDDCNSSYECQNYDSITEPESYAEMTELLLSELECHKVVLSMDRPRCVHALGAVRKANGKLRPITDCSRPDGTCINNFMESTFESFSYNSVDTAVQMLNPLDYLAVVDIAAAYRSVNVTAEQSEFQGLSWDFGEGPVWLRDLRLCFGLRCAPNIFNALSNFIVNIANSRGASRVVNYLDDFLVIAGDQETCLAHRAIVTSTLEHLGFVVSWPKVTEPSPVATFLGITIDTIDMQLSLPMAKVTKLKGFLQSLLDKGVASKKDLERVGGLVSHCSYVVRGGRTFSRRIFDLAASYSRQSRSIPLREAIKADFQWWLSFCEVFNGKACIIKDLHPIPLYSDASFMGYGAWMGLDWLVGVWDSVHTPHLVHSSCDHLQPPPVFDQPPKNINVYELWPVVVGIKRWAQHFRNCRLHVVTDNMQVLAMLNTGRSSNKTCMTWLREVFWTCFVYNMDIHASYIRSADNVLADALSRISYDGVVTKCSSLLLDRNMCCPHAFRSFDGQHPPASTTPEGRSMGFIHNKGTTLPDQLLP